MKALVEEYLDFVHVFSNDPGKKEQYFDQTFHKNQELMRQCQERDSQACQKIRSLEAEIESQKKQNVIIEKAEQNIQSRMSAGTQGRHGTEGTTPTNQMQIKLAQLEASMNMVTELTSVVSALHLQV